MKRTKFNVKNKENHSLSRKFDTIEMILVKRLFELRVTLFSSQSYIVFRLFIHRFERLKTM